MNSELLSDENTETDGRLLLLSPQDNVLVLRGRIEQGEKIRIGGHMVSVNGQISIGHKLAAKNISAGEKIIKYGAPIGSATAAINLGDHVHVHNLKSDYTPTYTLDEEAVVVNSHSSQKEKLL